MSEKETIKEAQRKEHKKLKQRMLKTFEKLENIKLNRKSSSLWFDDINKVRVCIMTSQPYPQTSRYWFTLTDTRKSFLDEAQKTYVFLGFLDDKQSAYLIPYTDYKEHFLSCNITDTGKHITINHKLEWYFPQNNSPRINLLQFKKALIDYDEKQLYAESKGDEIKREQFMNKQNHYIKSMEFCQDIIKRMADNSFRLKQFFLLAVTAIATIFSKFIFSEKLQYQFNIDNLLFLIPLFIFPYLDAYYLKQERLFREIYNDFMTSINDKIVRKPFDMKPTKNQRSQFSIWNVIFSVSVAPFYFIIICILEATIIYRSSIDYSWLWIGILPVLLLILGLIFKKKTSHQK